MVKRLLRNAGLFLSVGLFILALTVMHHKLKQYHYRDIVRQLDQVPSGALVKAGGLTVLDYAVLTAYDALALVYIGRRIKYHKLAIASFVGYVFSHNATIVGGSAARYRIYSALGVAATEVARLVVFCLFTFWLGFFAVCGIVFSLGAANVPTGLPTPFGSVRPIGVICLAIVGLYMAAITLRKRPVSLLGWEFTLPSFAISAGQVTIASVDWLLAAGVLYVLLPPGTNVTFFRFMGVFMLAQTAGVLSYVPGGLGVFETAILVLLGDTVETSSLVGSLVLYRLIYYILPLAIASILLAVHEVIPRRKLFMRLGVAFGKWGSAVAPSLFAFAGFVAGTILLFSGALPPAKGRIGLLRDLLPLPAIEASHFLGSVTGAGLLLLAKGLERRLDAAYHLTAVLLATGVVFSLLKGLDYEEAIILSVMLAALLPCHSQFYRKASLISQRFTLRWALLVAAALLCSVWLGWFSYKHVSYSHQLWWEFAVHGDAPRFLRASLGAIVLVFLYAVARLLVPARPEPKVLDRSVFESVRAIVSNSSRTYPNLALLGDKEFILSQKHNAFIMYGVERRTWVALGDPVGTEDEWEELAWQFVELCDQYDGWPVFYQIEAAHLDLYANLGMSFLKLGEEGRVELQSFSLEGHPRRGLRHTHNKIAKENYTFEIVPAEQVPQMLAALEGVSKAWLSQKNTSEKGFSLGFFSPDYVRQFPAAVVRKDRQIAAFANVWLGAEKEELSVDLMRYLPDCFDGMMDYLFVELLLWGKSQNYRWFNFGMAPLSGLEDRALAPLWSRAGAFVFRHGEHFYNFRGLREYKDKFNPQWQPRYLAYPSGLALPQILANIATLISGGVRGIVAK